jgi:ribose transport system substrate-binding protein
VKARFLPGLAAAAVVLLLPGCGTTHAPGKPRVALVMKSLANEFFKTMEDGARAHQKAHDAEYDLLAVGTRDEQDVAGQIRLVEQMVAEGVDALVIAPADSKALVPACRRARAAGLVVVNIDNRLDAAALAEQKLVLPFVGPDNFKGARAVGEYLARFLKAGDEVAILEGAPGAFNGQERRRGFEEAMRAAGIEVAASQTAHWETSRANQVAAALLTERPDLRALLCANDSMALGAVAALKGAGRNDVRVVGFDNITAVQELVRDGRVLATADQHGDRLAVFGIEYALEALQTRVPPRDQETPVDLVTRESLAATAAPASTPVAR